MAPVYDQWQAISRRIRALNEAARLYAQFLAVRSSDSYKIGEQLQRQCASILELIRQFRAGYERTLPAAALGSIDSLLDRAGPMVSPKGGSLEEKVRTALVLLAAFESEISFSLTDLQALIRLRSERAFAHLQRSIVADPIFRENWRRAFDEGEVSCEKLGAVHLLLHGIWAFKVNAAGGRTDLVYQEPLRRLSELGLADGLILTEWKRATAPAEAAYRFEEGRAQAKRYAEGVLAGIELTAYRFVIVVSRQEVDAPADVVDQGVIYRYVNIAVEPRPPSRG